MNFLTLIQTLETTLNRDTISTKNGPDTITYKGSITSVTINSEDTYSNVYQLFLTHDNSGTITLHVNHTKRNHTTDYKLSDITTLEVT